MTVSQLNLGYQYTVNELSLYKESNVYFIKGFVDDVYINLSFEFFISAKKVFRKLTK